MERASEREREANRRFSISNNVRASGSSGIMSPVHRGSISEESGDSVQLRLQAIQSKMDKNNALIMSYLRTLSRKIDEMKPEGYVE